MERYTRIGIRKVRRILPGRSDPSKKRKDLGPPIGKKSDSPYLGFLAGSYENIEMLYILSGSAIFRHILKWQKNRSPLKCKF